MRLFHYADDEEIKQGKTTDIYFLRTLEILKEKKIKNVKVVAEVTVGDLPKDWPWAVLCGIEEVSNLFKDKKVNIYSMDEGTIFFPRDIRGIRTPILTIEGAYEEFCVLETPLLGLICQSTGIATKSSRIKKIIGDKLAVGFGIRRMHPTISPMIDRASYIGGLDAVSSIKGAQLIGIQPSGTMPHALIIVMGDQIEAWKAFDEVISTKIPRVCLVDTYSDEKIESIMAAETLKEKLFAVRLDTPKSRKGNFLEIINEVRWELDIRGYLNVKIFVSGGLDEENLDILANSPVDAFGIGTSISNAPTVNFALDIVEVEGKYAAKKGKLGGKKQVWRCNSCFLDSVKTFSSPRPKCPKCGKPMKKMLKQIIKNGKIMIEKPSINKIRNYVLKQLEKCSNM